MKYQADDIDSGFVSWDKIAQDHLAIAQDILCDHYSRGPDNRGDGATRIALAQAHSPQALALIQAWHS